KGVGLHYKPFSTVFEKPAFMARDLAPKESSFRRNSRPNCESWVSGWRGQEHRHCGVDRLSREVASAHNEANRRWMIIDK
ncbi:MAG: hypothetical protein AB1898_18285, partial [Acidobacteriota bacterium]